MRIIPFSKNVLLRNDFKNDKCKIRRDKALPYEIPRHFGQHVTVVKSYIKLLYVRIKIQLIITLDSPKDEVNKTK